MHHLHKVFCPKVGHDALAASVTPADSASLTDSDVLLRHKRRCHEKEAAGTLALALGGGGDGAEDDDEGEEGQEKAVKPRAASSRRKRSSKKKEGVEGEVGSNGTAVKRRHSSFAQDDASFSESSSRPTARARLDDVDIDPALNDYGNYDLSTRSFLAYEAQQQATAHAVALAAAASAGDGQSQENNYSAYNALFASYPRMTGMSFSPTANGERMPYATDLGVQFSHLPSVSSHARAGDDSQDSSYDPAATLAAAATAIAAAQANSSEPLSSSSASNGVDRRASNGGGAISHNVEDAATLLSMAYGDRGGFDYATMGGSSQTHVGGLSAQQHRGSTSSVVSNNDVSAANGASTTTTSAVRESSGNDGSMSSTTTTHHPNDGAISTTLGLEHPKGMTPLAVEGWEAAFPSPAGLARNSPMYPPLAALLGADPASLDGAAIFAAAAEVAAAYDGSNLANANAAAIDTSADAFTDLDQELFSYLPGSSPQLANFNPERPLLRINSSDCMERFGTELAMSDKFFIPSDRFGVCYTIPHWGMPPMATLKRIARQTKCGLLSHIPLLHCPTFKLKDMPVGFAFAMVTVGSAKNSPLAGPSYSPSAPGLQSVEDVLQDRLRDRDDWFRGVSVIAPEKTPRTIADVSDLPSDEERNFDTRKRVVIAEKSQMLRHLFAAASGNLLTDFNFGMLEALFLFNVPAMLSPRISERAAGYAENRRVVEMAQRMGIFSPHELHAKPYHSLNLKARQLDAAWRLWVKHESYRRIAHLLFIFDTLGVIETAAEPVVEPAEILQIPNPAPESIWTANSAEEWNAALQQYRPASPEACLEETFQLFADGVRSHFERPYFNKGDFGMFARLSVIFAFLRAILAIARGEYLTSDGKYDISQMWRPSGKCMPTLTYRETLQLMALALNRVSLNACLRIGSISLTQILLRSGVKDGTLTACARR